jgi:hypothetical protein
MTVGHGHPSEMRYRDVLSKGNHVRVWRSLGQTAVESYLCLVGSEVDVNFGGGGGGISVIAWTLRGSMVILLWEMIKLRRCPTVT